jgi:hypothetical protein
MGDVAPRPSGHENFDACFVVFFKHQNFLAPICGSAGCPQTGGPTTDDNGIPPCRTKFTKVVPMIHAADSPI